jgi:hypothetical protein
MTRITKAPEEGKFDRRNRAEIIAQALTWLEAGLLVSAVPGRLETIQERGDSKNGRCPSVITNSFPSKFCYELQRI